MAGSLSEQEILNKVYDANSASLRTGVTLEGDIEIGAVEIKNGSSDQRAIVDAAGQLAVKEASGADIKTALELIDDAVFTDDVSTFGPGSNKALAVGGLVDDTSTDTADEGDFAALRLSARRAAMVSLDTRLDQTNDAITVYGSDDGGTTKRVIKTDSNGAVTLASLPAGTNAIGAITNTALVGPGNPAIDSFSSVAIAAIADTTNQQLVAAPGSGKQIWVYGVHGAFGTDAGTIAFQDEDDTALTGSIPGAANGSLHMGLSGNFAMPLFKVATNKALEIDTVTCSFAGVLSYAIVSV